MKNFAVIVSYRDNPDTHLFCVKAYSGTKAVTQAKLRYIDDYEAVMPAHQMIEVEDVVFRVYEITEESFK
jgi:hypothetical protein